MHRKGDKEDGKAEGVMRMSKPWQNAEGYTDLTAYHGITNAEREKDMISQVIGTLKAVARLAGFEIEGRIVLKNIKTGKEYR
jgi:hypothetical protein